MVYIVYRVAVYIFEISRCRDVDITRLFFKTATKLLLFFDTRKKKRQILLKNAVLTYLGVIFFENSPFIGLFDPLWCIFGRQHG